MFMELGLNRACSLVCIYEGVDWKVLDSAAHILFWVFRKSAQPVPVGSCICTVYMDASSSFLAGSMDSAGPL